METQAQRSFPFMRALITILQVVGISVLWLLADLVRHRFDLGLPSNMIGMMVMVGLLFTGIVRADWIRRGANWLLAEMLLFFIPAVLAVIKYPDVVVVDGWRVLVVIVVSTLMVMVTTAFVVDRLYRFELKLSRRRSNRHVAAGPAPAGALQMPRGRRHD